MLLADPPDGVVHDPNRSAPPPDEDEVEVRVTDDVPPSPPSALNRVITSCVVLAPNNDRARLAVSGFAKGLKR